MIAAPQTRPLRRVQLTQPQTRTTRRAYRRQLVLNTLALVGTVILAIVAPIVGMLLPLHEWFK